MFQSEEDQGILIEILVFSLLQARTEEPFTVLHSVASIHSGRV